MTGAGGFTGRVAVVIPACSGKDDIRSITARLRSAIPFADLLIVEHNSPDGTGRIAGELAATDRGIRSGRAAAGIRSGGLG
jgi:dolichol-phosphate mannosyltransferase